MQGIQGLPLGSQPLRTGIVVGKPAGLSGLSSRLRGSIPFPIPGQSRDSLHFGAHDSHKTNQTSPQTDYSHRDWRGKASHTLLQAPHLKDSDFTEAVLNHLHLEGKQLQRSIFDGGNLAGIYLTLAILEDSRAGVSPSGKQANFSHAFMAGSRLSRARFEKAILDKACLNQARGKTMSFEESSLKESDLTDTLLLAANFDRTDLTQADFRGGVFNDPAFPFHHYTADGDIRRYAATFRHAKLAGADFTGSDLLGADFSDADFRENNGTTSITRFQNTRLQHGKFIRAQMPRIIFRDCHLQFANFNESNLSHSDFTAVGPNNRLTGSSFHQTDLQHANFRELTLQQVDFTKANLANAQLQDLQGDALTFHQASLKQANLTTAKLPGSNLSESDLQEGILEDANLQYANLKGAKLQGADMKGAQLQGTNLSDAQFDDETRWTGATYNRYTRFPKGFVIPKTMIYQDSWLDKVPGFRPSSNTAKDLELTPILKPASPFISDASSDLSPNP